jgi:hypothetical protein
MTESMHLKVKLGIKKPEDWYRVKAADFKANDGVSLLTTYKGSCYNLLNNIYPELNLQPWRFAHHYTWWLKEHTEPFLAYRSIDLSAYAVFFFLDFPYISWRETRI